MPTRSVVVRIRAEGGPLAGTELRLDSIGARGRDHALPETIPYERGTVADGIEVVGHYHYRFDEDGKAVYRWSPA